MIPGSGRSPGEGKSYALQYSCLENPMDRGAWWATVHRVTKSRTRLKRLNMHRPISNVLPLSSKCILCVYSEKGHGPFKCFPFISWQCSPLPAVGSGETFQDERILFPGLVLVLQTPAGRTASLGPSDSTHGFPRTQHLQQKQPP